MFPTSSDIVRDGIIIIVFATNVISAVKYKIIEATISHNYYVIIYYL